MRLWTISDNQGRVVVEYEVHTKNGLHRLWNGSEWSGWMFCIPLTRHLCKKHAKTLNWKFKEDIIHGK